MLGEERRLQPAGSSPGPSLSALLTLILRNSPPLFPRQPSEHEEDLKRFYGKHHMEPNQFSDVSTYAQMPEGCSRRVHQRPLPMPLVVLTIRLS